MKRVYAKLGNMRTEQDFVVYPLSSDGTIIVQSDRAIGRFDRTGQGVLNTKGKYFPHLAFATPYQFPAEFVSECFDSRPVAGELIGCSAVTGPVYIANSD